MVWLRVPTQKKVSGQVIPILQVDYLANNHPCCRDYMLPSEDQKRSRLQYASLMRKCANVVFYKQR